MRRQPKLRRTFTLSPENLAFIERQSRQRKLPSQSAFLDELLLEKAREQRLADLESKVTTYYDTLTDQEVEEQRAWGQFAEQSLVLNEEELAHAQSTARRNMVHEAANGSSGKRKAPGRHRVGQRAK